MSLIDDVTWIMQNSSPDPSKPYMEDEAERVINKVLDAASQTIVEFGETENQLQFCLMIVNEIDKLRPKS